MYVLTVQHYSHRDITYYPTATRARAVAAVLFRRIGWRGRMPQGLFSVRVGPWTIKVQQAQD